VFTLKETGKTTDNKSMKLNENQYRKVEKFLPIQRGNVKIHNYIFLNAVIYRCKNGCSWRDLPKEFGNWHVIYAFFPLGEKRGAGKVIYGSLRRRIAACGGVRARFNLSKSTPGCFRVFKKTVNSL